MLSPSPQAHFSRWYSRLTLIWHTLTAPSALAQNTAHPLDFSHTNSRRQALFPSPYTTPLPIPSAWHTTCSVYPPSFTVEYLQEQSTLLSSQIYAPDFCPPNWRLSSSDSRGESWSEPGGGEYSVMAWISGPLPEPVLSLFWIRSGPGTSDETTGLGEVTCPF